MKKTFRYVGGVLLLALLSISGLAYALGEKYFYYPDQVDYGHSPAFYQQQFVDLTIPTPDGEKLHAWFVPSQLHANPKEALGTIVHYHGNAANLTMQYAAVAWLPAAGYNVLAFDYRGYGQSTGKPSFKGVYQDGVSVFQFAESYPDIDANKLIVFGQSLGGNVAIASVGSSQRQKVQAMVIDSTFYGYSAIANDKLKGAKWLVSDKYSAYQYLPKLTMPIFLMHGDADNVIPPKHMALLSAIVTAPKVDLLLFNTGHIEGIMYPTVQRKFLQFVQQAQNKQCCDLDIVGSQIPKLSE